MANLFIIIILIACTAFFVASEFAIVKVRSSRIDQLILEGNQKAISAKKVTSHLDEYLSATQLGITITSLGLGWLGEPTVQDALRPLFVALHVPTSISSILSFFIAFSLVTFFNVVVGELAPKTVAIQKAEAVTLAIARPLIIFHLVMFPFIWILNHSANLVSRLFGVSPASENEIAHSEEELRIILSESLKSGEINQSEYKYVNNIFEFDERIAKEIMVPRTEIISFPIDYTLGDTLDTLYSEQYTRYPIEDGDKDNIVGIVNTKEILAGCYVHGYDKATPISTFIKPVMSVIETIPIHDLLVKLQKDRSHMAILLDEYGGTAGIATIEDIIEEIVGEIRDEFDVDELPEVRKLGEGHYIIDSKLLITEVCDLLGIHLDFPEIDTLGGWYLTNKMDVHIGDILEEQGYQFIVNELDGHHILYVEVKKI